MSSKCRITKKRTPVYINTQTEDFNASIPRNIRNDIDYVVKKTKETGKEQSLTFCRLLGRNKKIYTSDYALGNNDATLVMPCNSSHGPSEKIGDLHTHPTQDPDTVGITPSSADITSTLLESAKARIPQISCITSNEAKGIHCYQPKKEAMNDPEKVRGYRRSQYYISNSVADTHPYFRANIGDDFVHAWYDRKTFKRIKHPESRLIVHDAFINSKNSLKYEDLEELEKGGFCQLVEDLNLPNTENRITEKCRKELQVREFLGIQY